MDLKILQWNIWFKERAKNIVAALRQADADIMCLQELTTDSFANPGIDMRSQITSLGYHYFYHQTLQHPGKNYYTMGNAIFSKLPIIATKTVYVQFDTPDHQALPLPRRARQADRLRVYNGRHKSNRRAPH